MSGFDSFDPDGVADELAWAFALFFTLLAAWQLVSSVTSSSERPPQRGREQSVTLHEAALCRLEDGETVRVERWHGHMLELSGTQVIDVTTVGDAERED